MVERLIVCCGVYISAEQWCAACNNQSEMSDGPSLTHVLRSVNARR